MRPLSPEQMHLHNAPGRKKRTRGKLVVPMQEELHCSNSSKDATIEVLLLQNPFVHKPPFGLPHSESMSQSVLTIHSSPTVHTSAFSSHSSSSECS